MADLLALEWDHDQICGVYAQVGAGRVRVKRCFVLGRPVVAVAGSGALPIDWLKSQLTAQGIAGGDVLVALPRDEAVVKRMDLPETSDDELPVLVRFQAGAKSSVPLTDLSLDFIPLPRRNEVPGREVLMATVPQQTITEIRTLCETAGLKLQTLGLTPAAVAEIVARAEGSVADDRLGASLVVARHGNRLEISVLRRCHLLFAHSARLSVDDAGHDPQTITSEVSRSLVALRGAISDVKIERVWTLLDPAAHEQLAEVLRKRLACDVQPLDPFGAVDVDAGTLDARFPPSQFSGPIGLLLAKAERRVPAIDFLAPREPPVKRDTRKERLRVIGIAAAALVLIAGAGQWWRLNGMDREIEELEQQEGELDTVLTRGKPVMKAFEKVDEWARGDMRWLDQLAQFNGNMPATNKIYITRLELSPKVGSTQPAKIRGDARAHDGTDDSNLILDLVKVPGYGLSPTKKRAFDAKDDADYPWEFDFEILLNDPGKKPAKGAAAPAAKPETPAAEAKAAAAEKDTKR